MPRLRRLALLCAALHLGGSASAATPAEARAAAAQVRQDVLPALDARRQSAVARLEAARSWFAGDAALEEAYPHLLGKPLGDPAWLSARLVQLQQAAEARAVERVAPTPPDLPDRSAAALVRARTAALDAEDAAHDAERRLLSALRAGLAAAPGLGATAVQVRLTELDTERQSLGAVEPDAEGAAALAERIVTLADQTAALRRLQAAAWRAVSIPGDTTLVELVAADRAALGPDADEQPIVDRLTRALPLLPEAEQAATRQALFEAEGRALADVEAELKDRRQALKAELADIDAADLKDDVSVYEARLQRAERDRAALDLAAPVAPEAGAPTDLIDQRARVRVLRGEVAALDEDLARRRVNRARRLAELGLNKESLTEADVTEAEQKATEAAARAEAARRSAQEADRLVAEALSVATEVSVKQVQNEQARQEDAEGRLVALEERLQAVQVDRETALSLPPLARERQERLEAVWRASDTLVADLRAELFTRAQECSGVEAFDEELIERIPDVASDVAEQSDRELVEQLAEQRATLFSRAEGRLRACRLELAASMGALARAKEARRRIEEAAPDAVQRTADRFVPELLDEIRAVPIRLRGLFWRLVELDPTQVSLEDQVGNLLGFIARFFEVLLVVAAWGLVRRRVPDLCVEATRWLARARRRPAAFQLGGTLEGWGVPGDWALMAKPATPVARHVLDALAGALVFALLRERAELLALPVLIWTGLQLVRAVPGVIGLALGTPADERPCLRRVDLEVRDLGLATGRWTVTWWVVASVSAFLILDLLDADRLNDLTRGVMVILGAVGVAVLLSWWWGPVRQAVAQGEQNQLTGSLTKDLRSPVLRVPVTAASVVLLLWRALGRGFSRLVESRAGLSWLGAALARQRLRDSDRPDALPPLPEDVLERLDQADHSGLEFTEEVAALHRAHNTWTRERRRGMASVIGPWGSGKSHILAEFRDALPDGTVVRELTPPTRCHDVSTALRWLAEATAVQLPDGLSPDGQARALAAALSAKPPQVIIIDDAQRLFLRAVGGFRALRRVLNVMHSTSEEHFWVCGFHGPSWGFLEGVSQAVNLAVFRTRVTVRPLDAQRLSGWLERWTAEQGLRADYQRLIQEGVVDPARAIERARAAFWLLMADQSAGNPKVALDFWLSSLHRADDPERALVTLFQSPRSEVLDKATDRDLFVLTALSIHDELGIAELAETLNLPQGVCRATCRHLEALGLLQQDEERATYRVQRRWLPLVGRSLRQKQFLHGG